MTHELAHQCGFMREDRGELHRVFGLQAVGRRADALQRSYLLAYDNAVSALGKVDPGGGEGDRLRAVGGGAARSRPARGHWAQYGPIQDVSNAANDTYLKANDQADGMRSYGRMVDLLLAEQRAEGARLAPEPLPPLLGMTSEASSVASASPSSGKLVLRSRVARLDLLFFPTGSIEWKSYNDRGSVEKPRLDAEGFEIVPSTLPDEYIVIQ